VLLVTLDTTRADHFGAYGHALDTTPHFDALAREGALFELAIATSSTTPISHASILTGLNPARHGVRVMHAGSGTRLAEGVPTLASVLREHGFETGAFLSAFPVSEHYGLERGFETFDNGLDRPAGGVMRELRGGMAIWDVAANQRRADATTDALLRWLADRREPFFAWIHYWDPHDPQLLPPDEVLARFAPDARYDAELFWVDLQFGRVVAALRERGVFERTLVAVVADHGEGLGDHGWQHHRLLYQEQIRVPLLLRIPGAPGGLRVPDLVRTIDVAPTLLASLGIEPPRPVEGRSLLGLLAGAREAPRLAYAEQLNAWDANAAMLRDRPLDGLLYCAMDRSWKLVYRAQHPERSELYQIAEDPGETRNLYREDHAQAVRLKAALDAFDGWRNRPFEPPVVDGDAERRLRSLGYLE
jgi:arylsulfatase A-like enzyme